MRTLLNYGAQPGAFHFDYHDDDNNHKAGTTNLDTQYNTPYSCPSSCP
jgi:hypothetical protein